MKRFIPTLCFSLLSVAISGCVATPKPNTDWQVAGAKAKPSMQSGNNESTDLDGLLGLVDGANSAIARVFPAGGEDKITLWAADLDNLVDGQYTSTFGAKLSPTPSIKLQHLVKGTGIALIDPLHVPVCTGVNQQPGAHWVLRTYVSDYDETVSRQTQGLYPSVQGSDIQAEIDRGDRATTDSFTLSAKLTDCATGRLIHSAQNQYTKTASTEDDSVYLFGKTLGLFYRKSKSMDPGLNATKDMALSIFLANFSMDMVGIQQDERRSMIESRMGAKKGPKT